MNGMNEWYMHVMVHTNSITKNDSIYEKKQLTLEKREMPVLQQFQNL